MNTQHSTIHHQVLTPDELERQGFTPQQIERFSALVRAYPWIEFVDSNRQWQRLLFLKWRYATGRLGR